MSIPHRYFQCPYCPKMIRKDVILPHLATHAELIVDFMTVEERKRILVSRIPIVSDTSDLGRYTCCLACHGGSIPNTQRMKSTSHAKCSATFDKYASLFTSEAPPDRRKFKWLEYSQEEYLRRTGKVKKTPLGVDKAKPNPPIPAILPREPNPPIPAINPPIPAIPAIPDPPIPATPARPEISEDLEARIIALWSKGRDPDDEVDEDHVTTPGKLAFLLNIVQKSDIMLRRANERVSQLLCENDTLKSDKGDLEEANKVLRDQLGAAILGKK